MYHQNYNPFGNAAVSTIVAAIPILVLLYFIALHPHRDAKGRRHLGIKAQYAAFFGVIAAFLVSTVAFGMPVPSAISALVYGSLSGFLGIIWIVLAAMALNGLESFESAAQAKRNLRAAIEKVAGRLGNTPTICRKCYVHPEVIGAYLDGTLVDHLRRRAQRSLSTTLPAMPPEEAAVLVFLELLRRCRTDHGLSHLRGVGEGLKMLADDRFGDGHLKRRSCVRLIISDSLCLHISQLRAFGLYSTCSLYLLVEIFS